MKTRESVRVAVAEASPILRAGIVGALKRAVDMTIQFIEIDKSDSFASKIRPYSPNILIINPLFTDVATLTRYRNDKSMGLGETKFIALLPWQVEPAVIAQYDAAIMLYDSEERLQQVIDYVLGIEDETEEDDSEELSGREKEVLIEVVKGFTNKEIAQRLNLSIYTVLTHRRNIARKLGIHSQAALVIYALSKGLISIQDIR